MGGGGGVWGVVQALQDAWRDAEAVVLACFFLGLRLFSVQALHSVPKVVVLTCLRMFVRSSVCAFSLVDRRRKERQTGQQRRGSGKERGSGQVLCCYVLCFWQAALLERQRVLALLFFARNW